MMLYVYVILAGHVGFAICCGLHKESEDNRELFNLRLFNNTNTMNYFSMHAKSN